MTQPASNERRVGRRVEVDLELHLERKVGTTLTVHTCDLGAGGARVISERPLRIDEEFHFDLDLPAGGCHLDGTARVLRQYLHDTYAVRFEHIDPGVLRDLGAFVEAYA
jgi:hypothetical protein